MQLRATLCATIACVAAASGMARADRPVQVELVGTAPFSADELVAALQVRVSGAGAGVIARVHATGADVVVAIGQRQRAVSVGARTGADAARLVALAIADLVLDDLAAPPAVTATAVPGSVSPPATRDDAADSIEIGVLGSAAAWSSVLARGSVDVTLPRGRWVAAAELGGGEFVDGSLHLSAATLRAGGGVRVRQLELLAHVVVSPIFVSDGVGDSTVLLGGGASARLRLAVATGVRAVFAVGVDAYATRTEYQLHTATMTSTVATPWVAPWFGLGIEVTP